MSMDAYTTQQYTYGITGRVLYDPSPEPFDGDTVGEIAYLSKSSYTLGTERVTNERMDEIRDGIRNGTLVGSAVFAYVHGGATIRASKGNPFDCQWDSGQSGFVYCTRERARELLGDGCTDEQIIQALHGEVELFDACLTGQVFGYEVLDADGDTLDSCWGFYGCGGDRTGGAEDAMHAAACYCVEQETKRRSTAWRDALHEARQRRYWQQRDVITVGA